MKKSPIRPCRSGVAGRLVAAAILAVLVTLPLAATASAQLADLYTEWRQGPVQILFLPADEAAWQQVSTDQQAEDFIRLFWAKRDPTPGTVENEFRRDFEQRAAFANERFGTDDTPGALSDRGRVFILLGPPRRIQSPGASGSSTGGDFGGGDSPFSTGGSVSQGAGAGVFGRGGDTDRMGVASEERWIYEDDRKPDFIKKRRAEIRFLTKPGTEEVELRNGELALGWMGEAKERAVTRPDLTLADLPSGDDGGSAALASSGGSGGGDGFQVWMGDAVTGDDLAALQSALSEAAGGGGVHLDAGAFQASDGRWIIPYQVSTDAPSGDTATLVGELLDDAGEPAVAFRLERAWTETKGQHVAKDTLVVPPGHYELRVGLEDAGGNVTWSDRESVVVPAAEGEYWMSELILSRDVHPMSEAQQMLEPYAWQGIVVVPEGDRTFHQGEVMWFYSHACHPQLDDAGKPNLRVTAKVEGPSAMRDEVPVQPQAAGDNCWVVATGLDLAADRFPAGDYVMTLQIRDSEGGKTLQSKESFTVAAN